MIKRIVLSLALLSLTSAAACAVDGPGAVADDEPAAVEPPTADGIGTSPSEPDTSFTARLPARLPIKPGTRWCAWPPGCTDPDKPCCTAHCEAAPDGTPLCDND